MIQRFVHWAIVLVAAVCTPSLLAHLVTPTGASDQAPANHSHDDGWRLTRQGWVQLSPRVIPSESAQDLVGMAQADMRAANSTLKAPARFDFHPAALALLIVVVAVGAFCLFPNERNIAPGKRSQTAC